VVSRSDGDFNTINLTRAGENQCKKQSVKCKIVVSLRDEVLIKDKVDEGGGFYTIIITDYTDYAD
jgi:hypothetical protein